MTELMDWIINLERQLDEVKDSLSSIKEIVEHQEEESLIQGNPLQVRIEGIPLTEEEIERITKMVSDSIHRGTGWNRG